MIEIYTDGACSGNPGPGGWGALLRISQIDTELGGGEPATMNNRKGKTVSGVVFVRSASPARRSTYFLGRFLAIFQKPRGSVIVKFLTSSATSSKSLSPVTSTSALAANAEARTH
jgi:hypothetical protein